MVTEQLFLAAKLLIHPSSKEPDYLLMLVLSNHSPGFLKVKDNAKDNSFTVLKLHFLYKQDYPQHENLAYFTIVCSVTLQNFGKWTCGMALCLCHYYERT